VLHAGGTGIEAQVLHVTGNVILGSAICAFLDTKDEVFYRDFNAAINIRNWALGKFTAGTAGSHAYGDIVLVGEGAYEATRSSAEW
jgi:hypothetical protein